MPAQTTILAPVDFSDATAAVVREASSLARVMNARVLLFSVIQPPVVAREYAAVIENLSEITAAGQTHATLRLAECAERLRADGISVETAQSLGAPIAAIVDQAVQSAARYIVMGSHGHTALYDLLVGSTTHGVLMRAPCPVVIVPAEKRKAVR